LGRRLTLEDDTPSLLETKDPPRKSDTAERPANFAPELAREVGLKFPSSARLIGVGRESGIDDMVRFKVELDPHDLAAFIATSPVPPEAFEPGPGGLLGPHQAFWDPSRAVRLRTGQAILKNQRALNIGIDDGRPEVVVLYVVNHGT
jgi:hypothetical protein